MAVRRLYEPLCIAFGTTVSSPTVPTYQLYDLPHKFTPRLYMVRGVILTEGAKN